MAEDQHERAPDPPAGGWEVVAAASNGAEAELICSRLVDAGVPAEAQRTIGGPEFGESGPRYIYVAPANVERAKEILSAPELSDDELARLSEEAADRPPE